MSTVQINPKVDIRLKGNFPLAPSQPSCLLEDGHMPIRRGSTIVSEPRPELPVGAVYINVTGTDPAIELGYGVWSSITVTATGGDVGA